MANTLHQLKRAKEIVERYRARGNVFPRELRDCGRGDPETQQEYRDACKVKTWKYSLLGKNIYNCSDEIRDYLNENMPGWSDRVYSHQGQSSSVQMQKAELIVQRYRERGNVLPRRLKDPTKAQETKDAINISTWKSSLKGYNRVTCSKELCSFLDANMPGWRVDHHKSKPRSLLGKEKARLALLAGTTTSELIKKEKSSELLMPIAQGIVSRFHANNNQYPSLKLVCRNDPSRAQEYSDAKQLHSWKSHTDMSLAPEVFEYLDYHMKDWKNSHVTHTTVKNVAVTKAREIFRRCSMRNNTLPRLAMSRPSDAALILEHKDALALRDWKIAFVNNPTKFCPSLQEFLDDKLIEWRNIDILSPLPYDMKADKPQPKANTSASPCKRKKSVSENSKQKFKKKTDSTDGEVSSEDETNSLFGSDNDDDEYYASGVSSKKMKHSHSHSHGYYSCSHSPSQLPPAISSTFGAAAGSFTSIDSDESAGIAALLQLSAGPSPTSVPESASASASVTLPVTVTVTGSVPVTDATTSPAKVTAPASATDSVTTCGSAVGAMYGAAPSSESISAAPGSASGSVSASGLSAYPLLHMYAPPTASTAGASSTGSTATVSTYGNKSRNHVGSVNPSPIINTPGITTVNSLPSQWW